jgi:hypothetical protein
MQTRHRIPTIFNLSMVDVLCCALGCVILLWLVNFREAKRRAAAAGETSTLLADTRSRLEAASLENADARQKLRSMAGERDGMLSRLAALETDLAAARARGDGLTKDAASLRAALAGADKDATAMRASLAGKDKDAAAIRAALSAADDRLQKSQGKLAALQTDRDATAKLLESKESLLREKSLQFQAASRAADDVATLLRESEKKSRGLADDLSKHESRIASLQSDLTAQKSLTTQAMQARLAAENRFAGIAMTGRRVVFLVDMSGSMDYVDEKTVAPDKWKGVRESLVKIMKSLPELEKFQVVLFSDKASFLLGNDDRWLSYDPKTSSEQAAKALAAIKPTGNTNMYAAFDAAFRYRGEGLDTVYLLSDGLPNIGAGLTAEQARTFNEFQRTEALSVHVRKMLKTTWNRPDVNRTKVRINAVGFFYESPDVGAFLWALARENDGSFVGMSKP